MRPSRSSKPLRRGTGPKSSESAGALKQFVEVPADGAAIDSLEDKKLRFTRRVLFLARRWRNLMDDELRGTGDSHARWITLTWIELLDGKTNHRELAERVGVELPTLVRLLNRLEQERLVARGSLGTKGRAKSVVLTARGRDSLAAMTRVVNATRARFLDSIDGQQLTSALDTLDALLGQYATVVDWRGSMLRGKERQVGGEVPAGRRKTKRE
jgi:MarR family transcriptional regulator for hemolysin